MSISMSPEYHSCPECGDGECWLLADGRIMCADWPECGEIRGTWDNGDKLAKVRALAESLGDRTDEPAHPAPEVKVHLPLTDRRIVEPIRRMLLEILDGPS